MTPPTWPPLCCALDFHGGRVATDVDKDDIRPEAARICAGIAHRSHAVFFYAGHGIRWQARITRIRSDAKLRRPPTFRSETVDIDQIVAVMQSGREPRESGISRCLPR